MHYASPQLKAGRAASGFASALLALCGFTLGAGAAHGDPLRPWNGGATPALVLKDPAGKIYDLAAYRGKVVLVNFWATWCPPCREEMPSMQALRQELGGRGFEVLAVNLSESEEKIAAFSDAELIDLPFPMDRDGAAARRWKVNMLPASFVVDRSGRIRYHLLGETNWTGADVKPLIERLLGAGTNSRSASAAQ